VAVRQSVRIVVGLVAAGVALTACGGSKLTVGGLDQEITPALATTTGPCPLPYDVAAAAGSSRIAGDVTLADTDPVSAENADSPQAADSLKQNRPALDVECDYQVGHTDVTTFLLATSKPDSAVSGALPEIVYLAQADPTDIGPQVLGTEPGTAVPLPGGRAAVVRLDVDGGDGVLVVGVDPTDGISPTQLATFTQTLAGQIS
jgi:hypothetical protein